METSNHKARSAPSLSVLEPKTRIYFGIFVVYESTFTMAENPEGGAAQESGGYDYKRLHSYPLIRVSR